jgi:signal transduction histidine kinase
MGFLKSVVGRKFILATVLAACVIIGGVTAAMVMLRVEAINTHLKIAELHSRTFADHLNQTVHSMDIAIENISSMSDDKVFLQTVNQSFADLIHNSPHVRSISLLNEKNEVVASSNQKNIATKVSLDDFLPTPFLNEPLLRFGGPKRGRDIDDISSLPKEQAIDKNDVSFVPMIKKISTKSGNYTILIALNSDYFINRYGQSLDVGTGFVDVLRIDGVLLFSTDPSLNVGKVMDESLKVLNEGRDASSFVGSYGGKESLLAYQLLGERPLSVLVRLGYDDTLRQWERQRLNVLVITTVLVVVSAALLLLLLIRTKKQQAMEEQILKSKIAAMGELISMIAHQWRQPLAVVSAMFSNICDAFEDGELTQEYLDKTNKQAGEMLRYMSRTIDDFRRFFKPQESKDVFSLCDALKDSILFIYSQLSSLNIQIYVNDKPFDAQIISDCSSEMPVEGFRSEFIQAIISLIKNSKEAIEKNSPKDAQIRIGLRADNNKYILTIGDNAGGIEPKIIKRIFEPYFTTKHQAMGAGMGLYVVKMLIENGMDGSIDCKNTDDGAMFTIELGVYVNKTEEK